MSGQSKEFPLQSHRPWWSLLGIGSTITFRMLVPILVIHSVIILFINILGFSMAIYPTELGYLLYLANWAPLLNIGLPAGSVSAHWIGAILLISTYQLFIVIFSMQFDAFSSVPWWTQLRTVRLPSLEGAIFGIAGLSISLLIPVIVASLILPFPTDDFGAVPALLKPFQEYLGPFLQPFQSFLGPPQYISLAIGAVLFFLIVAICSSMAIQFSLITLSEELSTSGFVFSRNWAKFKGCFLDGVLLFVTLPLGLALILLGGTLFILFPVLAFNFITQEAFISLTGSWMTKGIETVLLASLFFYPFYPAITWGQFYRHRLALTVSKEPPPNTSSQSTVPSSEEGV